MLNAMPMADHIEIMGPVAFCTYLLDKLNGVIGQHRIRPGDAPWLLLDEPCFVRSQNELA